MGLVGAGRSRRRTAVDGILGAMNRAPVTTFLRLGVPAVLAGALLSLPAPAQAATTWHTVDRLHGARTQVCKTPAPGGWTVRVRVDNRGGDHWHRAHLGNRAGTRWVDTRAAAGAISPVRSVFSTGGISVGTGDARGDRGGYVPMDDVGRC